MKLTDVTQGKLERYEEALLEGGAEVKSVSRFNRVVLEAAQAAGVATELPADLGALQPWQVTEWTRLVLEHVAKAKQPPSEGEL